MKSLITVLLFIVCVVSLPAQKVLKVLAIGNSFSVDAIEQNLYELAHAQGDSLVIGNAYIGGCTIDRHWENTYNGKTDYSYRKVVGGVKITKNKVTLKEIIQDDEWDVITVQQASPYSGYPPSFSHLSELMNYVKTTAHKPFRFAYHETWAFSKESTRIGFKEYYQNRQFVMYQSILNTVYSETRKVDISDIIPCAVSIQRARAILGDSLTRDGFHLEKAYGRYVAACTWCEYLTGKSVLGNPYHPESITPQMAYVAQKSAHEASEMQKAQDITPVYYINGDFYKECPQSVEYQLMQCHKAGGKKIMTINTPAELPDADRFYAIPEFKVKDAALLKQLAGTEDNAKIVKGPAAFNQITNSKEFPFSLDDAGIKGKPSVFVLKKGRLSECETAELEMWKKICPQAEINVTSAKTYIKQLNIKEFPTMILVDKDGKIRQSFAGTTRQKCDQMLKELFHMCRYE